MDKKIKNIVKEELQKLLDAETSSLEDYDYLIKSRIEELSSK